MLTGVKFFSQICNYIATLLFAWLFAIGYYLVGCAAAISIVVDRIVTDVKGIPVNIK